MASLESSSSSFLHGAKNDRREYQGKAWESKCVCVCKLILVMFAITLGSFYWIKRSVLWLESGKWINKYFEDAVASIKYNHTTCHCIKWLGSPSLYQLYCFSSASCLWLIHLHPLFYITGYAEMFHSFTAVCGLQHKGKHGFTNVLTIGRLPMTSCFPGVPSVRTEAGLRSYYRTLRRSLKRKTAAARDHGSCLSHSGAEMSAHFGCNNKPNVT